MVLSAFRSKKVKKWVLIGILVLILPAFVLWGVGNLTSRPKPVGKIGGQTISNEKFYDSVQGIKVQLMFSYAGDYKSLESILKSPAMINLMAWERLILLNEANRKKIKASNSDVLQFIATHPLFQRNGVFDKKTYDFILKSNLYMDAREFEEAVRENLKVQKLRADLLKDITVTDQEVVDYYKKLNDKVILSYFMLTPKMFSENITVTEEEMKKYYDTHKKIFYTPEQVEVEFIEFAYNTPSERRKVNRELEKIYPPFAKNPHEFKKTAESLGYTVSKTAPFSRENVIAGVEFFQDFHKEAFAIEEGSVGMPLFSGDEKGKAYIIRKIRTISPEPIAFDKVSGEIKSALIKEKSLKSAKKKADQIIAEIKKGSKTFNEAAKSLNLKVQKTPAITYNGYIENIGPAGNIVEAALTAKKGNILNSVTTLKGILVCKVDDIIPVNENDIKDKETAIRRNLLMKKQMERMDNWFRDKESSTRLFTSLENIKQNS